MNFSTTKDIVGLNPSNSKIDLNTRKGSQIINKKHKIIIDETEIEISEESYLALKCSLIDSFMKYGY